MTWETFHRRGEVLKAVLDEVELRRDGTLPMDVPGVQETFGDELSLLGALQLRWHTHLSGAIERELMEHPADLEAAVMTAWRTTATELAGVRAVLDTCTAAPTSEEMAQLLAMTHRKDWTLMAAMAGKASPSDRLASSVGRRIEERARAAYRPSLGGRRRAPQHSRHSLIDRVKAHLPG